MDVLVHVRIKVVKQIFASHAGCLPADKPVRNKNSLNRSINKLIDRKRDVGIFQFLYRLFGE